MAGTTWLLRKISGIVASAQKTIKRAGSREDLKTASPKWLQGNKDPQRQLQLCPSIINNPWNKQRAIPSTICCEREHGNGFKAEL